MVSEPRIPAGGPGGNTQGAAIVIRGDQTTTHIHAALDAPPPTPFLSTGFPYTEGTRLWELDADGEQIELRYLFPIRGAYTFTLDETRADGTHLSQKKQIAVPEDPRTVSALVAFVMLLFGAGAVAGSVLAGNAALQTAALLCAALLSTSIPAYAFDIAAPKPGTLWPIVARAAGPTLFLVEISNVEEGKHVFHATLPSHDGRLHLKFQFYDGAPHVLAMLALRNRTLLQTWRKDITVDALPPPLGRRLWVFFEMLLVFALGYFTGVITRLRRAACTRASLV
jgi:hypothetical protein